MLRIFGLKILFNIIKGNKNKDVESINCVKENENFFKQIGLWLDVTRNVYWYPWHEDYQLPDRECEEDLSFHGRGGGGERSDG